MSNTSLSGSTLNFEAYMTAAEELAGLDDFGNLDFVDRAKQWLECVASESKLSEAGRAVLGQVVTGWLVNRLRFADDLKKHPEILEEVVREPIFVTGMPRTGTTKLQRLIASDPAVQSLPFWIILNIAPTPGADPVRPDPRIAIAGGYADMLANQFPDFLTAHPAFVGEPEEESFWMETDFRSMANCVRVRAPSYWSQIKDSPDFESLPFIKRCLQYVQWQRGAAGRRPWVLKAPNHFGNLDALYKVFPDATVLHTYRDPIVALPSICRIVEVFRGMSTDDIDLKELGAEQLAMWSEMMRRHMLQRDEARVIDVRYDDINQDAMPTVRAIYRRRGKELGEAAERVMCAWEAKNPQHQFGRHTYSLERYGLTQESIHAAFRDYIERFGNSGTP